jgi:hypothetical protein
MSKEEVKLISETGTGSAPYCTNMIYGTGPEQVLWV